MTHHSQSNHRRRDTQNRLAKPAAAVAFQIRSVSQERFVHRIGAINSNQIAQILRAAQIEMGAA